MATRIQQVEPLHCWLLLEDGRSIIARCIRKPNDSQVGYEVIVDRHDMPDDLVKRAEVQGMAEFRFMRAFVLPEKVDFNDPPTAVFPDYSPLQDARIEREG